jgi:hypothetical protein
MENLPARTVNGNSASGWFATAGTLLGHVWSAVRAFRGVVRHQEPRREGGRRHPPPWLERGELPDSYGRTKVVAMAVSPYLVHVYWDLQAKQLTAGAGGSLRFSDAAAGESFDVKVDLAAKNWYVHLWSPEKRYSVELMVNQESGPVAVARSNPVETPRAWPVAEVNESFTRLAPARETGGDPQRGAETAASQRRPVEAGPIPATAAPTQVMRPSAALTSPKQQPKAEPPAVEPPIHRPAAQPVNAIDLLRQRLGALYALRRWHAPPRPVLASAALEEQRPERQWLASQRPRLLDTIEAGIDLDFTTQVESRFSPGLSSVLLGSSAVNKLAG